MPAAKENAPCHFSEVKVLKAIVESEERVRRDIDLLRVDVLNHVAGRQLTSAPSGDVEDAQSSGGADERYCSSTAATPVGWVGTDPRRGGSNTSIRQPPQLFEVWSRSSGGNLGQSALGAVQASSDFEGFSKAASASQRFDAAGTGGSGMQLQTPGNATAKFWHGWPATIPLLPEFCVTDDTVDSYDNLRSVAQRFADREVKPAVSSLGIYEAATQKGLFTMIRPDSERRLLFDGLCLFVLLFDVVFTPYYLTWKDAVSDTIALPVLILTTTFWTLDLFLSFFTGSFNEEGLVEMRFKKVAKRYLRTWFPADFLCVAADLVNLLPFLISGGNPSSASSIARFLRMVKLARFLRVVGMVRMLRVLQAFNMYMEAELSESWRMVVRILQISGFLIWMGHLCACAWYAIGTGAPRGEVNESWIDTPLGRNGYIYDNLGPSYQYVLAYQWGLAQLVLGSHDVIPMNLMERVFTIVCNLFGLIFGGTLISILSTTLIDLKEINQEKAAKMRTLKDFLLQHQVDIGVRLRILHQVRDRVKQRDRILVEKDVKALQVLSHPLLRELRYNLFTPHLLKHTMFRAWGCVEGEILKHLCGESGIEYLFFLPDDELFSAGEAANAGYHLVSGELNYHFEMRSILAGMTATTMQLVPTASSAVVPKEDVRVEASSGTWLCEAAWWCIWYHVGTATATEPSTLLSLSHQAIANATSTSLTMHAITQEYARNFHLRLVQSEDRGWTPPTDVRVLHSQLSDIIFSMSTDVHMILGIASLEQALANPRQLKVTSSPDLLKMEQEIREGRAIILLDEDGLLQRQVALIVLRLEREDLGAVLTEIAVYDSDDHIWRPRCRLPGTKQKSGETPQQSLQRFLGTHLECVREDLNVGENCLFTTQREVTASASFGIGTTYNKSIFSISVSEEHMQSMACFGHSTEAVHVRMSGRGEARDDLLRSLALDIREVYVLSGSDQVAMYAWLDDNLRNDLSQHGDVLSAWVSSLGTHIMAPHLQVNGGSATPRLMHESQRDKMNGSLETLIRC
mmetsp:Transcript_33862/g.79165  ORF Transcript_33862/g.79165 Transcript_33862/m.79165 type:complete len:1027 (+) Transcript_33862:66-3146(+)